MAQRNPYSGSYSPARMSLSKQDLVRGIKGIKVRAPNKTRSTTAYKTALPKEYGSEGSGM